MPPRRTCAFATAGCGLSTPCARCRHASSGRDTPISHYTAVTRPKHLTYRHRPKS